MLSKFNGKMLTEVLEADEIFKKISFPIFLSNFLIINIIACSMNCEKFLESGLLSSFITSLSDYLITIQFYISVVLTNCELPPYSFIKINFIKKENECAISVGFNFTVKKVSVIYLKLNSHSLIYFTKCPRK